MTVSSVAGSDREVAGSSGSADASHDVATAGGGESRSVPVLTVVLFLAGCVVMVVAAANIGNLNGWADRWGQVLVFLVFFLVMAIGGRWFWAGVDALIAAARGKGR